LDIPEMGVLGYSGMVMDKEVETPQPKGFPSAPMNSRSTVSTH